MATRAFLLLCILWMANSIPLTAQRLLWEQAFVQAGAVINEGAISITLTGNQQFLLAGFHSPPFAGPGCLPTFRAYYRVYDFNGGFVREKLGRGLSGGNMDYARTSPGIGWTTATGMVCVGTPRYARPFVQRVTAAGDTGRAWYLAPALARAYSNSILAQGNKLVTAGYITATGQSGQSQQVQLTCSDTLGRVRWQRNYPRLPQAFEYAVALVPTPRGGYLISGDAFNFAPGALGYDHYVLETDSMGLFRRARIIQPLGPNYKRGSRLNTQCNIIALPNAAGYLLSGTADSVDSAFLDHNVGYVMRLDTALNVQWVYRHPPALSGSGAIQNYAYRLRLLANNTVGLLLTDVRGAGTPDIYLVQVNVSTGQRVGFYVLSSNSQAVVVPTDWQLVGDGTVLICGQSKQLGASYSQSYLARWDFRGTPLAARTADEATAMAAFTLSPNPSTGPVTIEWQLPPGGRAGQLRLYSVLGQLTKTLPLPPTASGRLEVAGLAPGIYLARLLDAAGAGQGRAQRLLVRE